jgi:hypothetical protein
VLDAAVPDNEVNRRQTLKASKQLFALVLATLASIQPHWIGCLGRGVEPATSGRNNLSTLALVEATNLSARQGRSIKMSEIFGADTKGAR